MATLFIVQTNKTNLELLDAAAAQIPIPKIEKTLIKDSNILGVIITCPIFKDFNFMVFKY